MDRIRGEPTPGLTYNVNDSVYWDEKALAAEIDRVFDICHGCRLCFNLCPSFPELFGLADQRDGRAAGLAEAERDRVIDACYQCKLCYVKCPYTPDDRHPFQLDFPRLLLRANAVRRRRRGLGLRQRLLANPDRLGRLASLTPGLVNWANRAALPRWGLELALGIHRDKVLPRFCGQTFDKWFRRRGGEFQLDGPNGKVALFYTCTVNYNNPEVGQDAVRVFEKNRLHVRCPKQNCCGMPALESGDVALARRKAESNVAALAPLAEQGYKVLAINPSCSYMMRKEYPELLDTAAARLVAGAVMDVCEYLFTLKRAGTLNRDFRSTPESVACHVPCHLKAQNIGFRSRDMLKTIPGVRVQLVEQCSGHDGTWSMKKEFFPLSMLAGKKAFDEIRAADAKVLASDCPLAGLHFEQATGRKALHPIQVLARAYREDGFPARLPAEEAPSDPAR